MICTSIPAYDGDMYYIPYLPDGKYGRAWFVRQDWLDALGPGRPDRVDELYDMLVAFRDDDPNGNGKKNEGPFFVRDREELARLVTLWDGRSSGSDTPHDVMVTEAGRIAHPYAQENHRIGLSHIARRYEEGLIDRRSSPAAPAPATTLSPISRRPDPARREQATSETR
ncbi:type 2 periplasmic-binding domain-containing protein [Limimaricola litoreus]|uniref:Uncharacterized protein n=1 Tax=Limimaricola litoreus TaxID=2955316 RepID=A0A9X2FNL2_9RHOB|nr:hypothetical protein [Limimaricola litoreus]MCP1168439.1 hypothetical protein [Limimaricola litoreus]